MSLEVLGLSEFVVMACAPHDAQNAFRWSMGCWLEDKGFLRAVYDVIDSLRNTMDIVHSHLAEWIVRRMSFTASKGGRLG